MSDESNYRTNPEQTNPEGTPPAAGTAERVGFCQDCGTPLTRETVRPVGTGVFCEPCLTARVGATGGYTTVPPVAGVPPMPPVEGTPHPVLAAFLSVIPGLGTVYNGQYAKGVAYLLMIVVLDSLGKADHLGIFGLLSFVLWVYQIYDAYQTAKARLEGRPLPNPFGLNEIGERLGFGKGWGNTAAANAAAAASPTGAPAAAPMPGYSPVNTGPVTTGPVGSGPDWVGYVPPTNFASAPSVPPMAYTPPSATGATQSGAAWGQAPYAQTYTGGAAYPAAPTVSAPFVPPARRFPTGAIWLIGLGLLFLLTEFSQEWGWSLNHNWLLALLFAGLAAWTLVRRVHRGVQVVCVLRWPVVLAVLAVLFALQAADAAPLWRTWPVLFIVFGALLILERTALGHMSYGGDAYPYSGSVVPPPGTTATDAEQTRAAWAAHTQQEPADSGNNDLTKSGGL